MSVYEADEGFPRVARQSRALTAVTLVMQCCMRSIAAASRLKHQRISQIFSRPSWENAKRAGLFIRCAAISAGAVLRAAGEVRYKNERTVRDSTKLRVKWY